MKMSEPTTPIDAYKAIIDQLVSEVRLSGASSHVAKSSFFSKAPADSRFNDLVQKLSPADRTLLSQMLQEERDDAIHDVLAALTWWITTRNVGLTFQGQPMPVELSGMGLHGDYVGRREGWEWPRTEQSGVG